MNLSYGSQGEEVRKLQEALNSQGYGLSVDGIYGAKTQAAVRDYQSKNSLAVDGIAGVNTQGKLYSTQTAGTTAQPDTAKPVTQAQPSAPAKDSGSTAASTGTKAPSAPEFKYSAYQESDAVRQAQALLQQQLSSRPGEYQSQWQDTLNEILNRIQNREDFSYDLNGDALYQQYKDRYIQQGQQAMMDTMGQAAALTGGYGNSYAQNAGQQAYQGYLQGLNDKIPELYQLALDRYNQEGQDLYNQFALIGDQENQDYSRYRDSVSDFYSELDRLYNQYLTERDYDYGRYTDDRGFAYQTSRDNWADQQWKAEYDEAMRQYNEQMQYQQSSDNRKYAYDTAMGMISAGVMPGDQMLADAGLSKADAQAMVSAYLAQAAASGGSGGGGGRSGGSRGGGGRSGGRSGGSGQQSSGYTSGFQQATGSYRNSSVGKLFTSGEYKKFQQQVGMCRGMAGRAAMVDDAFQEGKITGAQASETLKAFGISEAEFDKLRGYH